MLKIKKKKVQSRKINVEKKTFPFLQTVECFLPSLATNWTTMLSPAMAHRTSYPRGSWSISQLSFDWNQNERTCTLVFSRYTQVRVRRPSSEVTRINKCYCSVGGGRVTVLHFIRGERVSHIMRIYNMVTTKIKKKKTKKSKQPSEVCVYVT